jgi:hypothetical protein
MAELRARVKLGGMAAPRRPRYNPPHLRGGPDWGLRCQLAIVDRSPADPMNLIRLVPA